MRKRRRGAVFYAFDLLWQDGEDLRQLALVGRKRRLRPLIKGRTRTAVSLLYAWRQCLPNLGRRLP